MVKNAIIGIFMMGVSMVYGQSKMGGITSEKPLHCYNATSYGLLLGGGYGSSSLLSTTGLEWRGRIGAGVTVGIEKISYRRYAPILLEAKYNLLKTKNSPFVTVNGGIELPVDYRIREFQWTHGNTIGISAGMNIFCTEHIALSTSIGYRYSYFGKEYFHSNQTYYLYYYDCILPGGCYDLNYVHSLHRMEIKIGLYIR